MATLTYNYVPTNHVFVVNPANGVHEAVITEVTATITSSGTVLKYKMSYVNALLGVTSDVESNLYGNVDTALAAYKTLIQAGA